MILDLTLTLMLTVASRTVRKRTDVLDLEVFPLPKS